MINPQHQPDPDRDREADGELGVSQFREMFDLILFFANMSSVDHLTAADVEVLEQFSDQTYSGHLEVNTNGEYATDRKHYALPTLMSRVEAISVYRDAMAEFSEGPAISPELLPRAIDSLQTLGKTVVGVFQSVDGNIENATSAVILYIPGGGQFSMTRNPDQGE